MNETVLRPEDVSEELGLSPTQIRNFMRLGRFNPPIGYAYKGTGRQYSYRIYRSMLDEYLHKVPPVSGDGAMMELLARDLEEREALRKLLASLIEKE